MTILSRRRETASLPALRPITRGIRQWRAPLGLAMLAGLCLSLPALADDNTADAAAANAAVLKAPKQLEEVEVKANTTGSAILQAPTQADLTITQPQSIIGLDWISNHVSPTADYATIAAIAPL